MLCMRGWLLSCQVYCLRGLPAQSVSVWNAAKIARFHVGPKEGCHFWQRIEGSLRFRQLHSWDALQPLHHIILHKRQCTSTVIIDTIYLHLQKSLQPRSLNQGIHRGASIAREASHPSLLECFHHLSNKRAAASAQVQGRHTRMLRYAGGSRCGLALDACGRLGKVVGSRQISQPPACRVGVQCHESRCICYRFC